MTLACYASEPASSRGRLHAQPEDASRNVFQRDRDRIVHSAAFRRLGYKTQVFLNHEGDLFRTRLTHSIEVAQIGRTIARALSLNEDLVEAISLAHDVGHTPFGHAGQDALNECMLAAGGFEHNLQNLRVVDRLEERYPQFDGLNLCFETREGILKHCSRLRAQRLEQTQPNGVARRFLDGTQPSLEAQLSNLADEIAYNAHDIDDGVRAGLLSIRQLSAVSLFKEHLQAAQDAHPHLQEPPMHRRLLFDVVRRMLNTLIVDVVKTSRAALIAGDPNSAEAARRQSGLISLSVQRRKQSGELKLFYLRTCTAIPRCWEQP